MNSGFTDNRMAGAHHGPTEAGNVILRLQWHVFDGGRRGAEFARAHDQVQQTQAQIKRTQDDIEQQVWTDYLELRTAFRQRDTATALLTASQMRTSRP